MREENVYVLMRCSCPDDHEPVAAFSSEVAAKAAVDLLDGSVERDRWDPDDEDRYWMVYYKQLLLNPDAHDAKMLVRVGG